MVKFNGVILNSEVDLNGNQISPEALKQAAKQLKNIPIGFEFNPSIPPIFGYVRSAKYKQGKVIASGEVDKPNQEAKWYIVPSFIVKKSHKEGAITVLDDIDLLEIGLTTQPADRHLTPVKQVKIKDIALHNVGG